MKNEPKRNIPLLKVSICMKSMKKDFIDFIHNSQTGDVPSEKRTVRVPKANGKYPFWGVNDDLRCVYGVIETGLYGKKIEVVNKDNPTAPLFEADDKNAAVIKPFCNYSAPLWA